ncbi:MAG: hypothetical protein JW874_09625 [Spirochaetales bacterium]|nr:hypothetical protein [Spirochaetales bacterium]
MSAGEAGGREFLPIPLLRTRKTARRSMSPAALISSGFPEKKSLCSSGFLEGLTAHFKSGTALISEPALKR